jgi:hypothetical protein
MKKIMLCKMHKIPGEWNEGFRTSGYDQGFPVALDLREPT